MGLGYLIGCLGSIVLWKVDRHHFFSVVHEKIKSIIQNEWILQLFYMAGVFGICYVFFRLGRREIMNGITAFCVIDISNAERKNLKQQDKRHFYDTISLISRALVCGFMAPLLYILFLGNAAGLAYMFFYHFSLEEELRGIRGIFHMATIFPSLLVQFLLYLVYVIRNKAFRIDFKGDYLINCLWRPLLNVDILAAYIETVNFYYYYNEDNMHYLKSYGDFTRKIDYLCIKDYLSIAYGICFFIFLSFYGGLFI